MTEPLLEARGVTRVYDRSVQALAGIDLAIHAGDRVGIVGESGSGKSTLIRIMAALDQPTSGTARFDGEVVSNRPERELARLRAGVQVVFQDPRSSLNPRMRVGRIIAEPLRSRRLRKLGISATTPERLSDLLAAVGLPQSYADRFPHELSGGERQRVAIARALAPSPRVVIADEPVSALDVAVRAHVLNLLSDLVREHGLTLVVVAHDLAVVRQLCSRVVVMQGGQIVEQGPTEEVYERPQHPYTAGLLAAIPRLRV